MSRRTHIGKYEILERVAEGGFGVVYKARDPFIKRLVAVKTCAVGDQNLLQRFFREAEIAGNLHHRNITIVHDFGVEGDVAYLVQEYLSGEDLLAKLRNREPLTLAQKLDYLLQAAIGLGHAHSKGVIHRDVKPGNIRVLENGLVKIMDFGIAKLTTSRTQLTQKGMTVGTVGYLSPEQIRDGAADQRSDIFSYGVVAYELLAYRRPFYGRNLADLLPQILDKDPEPLGRVVPDCPPALAALVGRCLEKEPQRRYQSFDEVIASLRPILGAASRAQRALEAERTTMISGSGGTAVAAEARQGAPTEAAEGAVATATATAPPTPPPEPPDRAVPPAQLAGEWSSAAAPGDVQREDTQPVMTLRSADEGNAGDDVSEPDGGINPPEDGLEAQAEHIASLISKGELGTALEALEATVERHSTSEPSMNEEEEALAALGPIEEAPEVQESTRRLQRPTAPTGDSLPTHASVPAAAPTPSAAGDPKSPSLPSVPSSPTPEPRPTAAAAPERTQQRAAAAGPFRPVPVPLLAIGGTVLLLLAVLTIWWATRGGETNATANVPNTATAVPTPEATIVPPTGSLILLAAPWGEVRRITAADGTAIPLPAGSETPLRLELPPGLYRAEIGLPEAEQPASCEAEVVASAEGTCLVELQQVDTTDYFKQAGWWR